MKGSRLLNMKILSSRDGRLLGLVKDARVYQGRIQYLVLSTGGLFSKAIYVEPGDVQGMTVDTLTLKDDGCLKRESKKEMAKRLEGTFSVFKIKVYDRTHTLVGKVADFSVGQDFTVAEYEISRSFWDDIDRGYALVAAKDLTYGEGYLHYGRHYYEIERTQRDGGIVQKLIGEDYHEDITL